MLYPKTEADVQEMYEELLAHPDPRFKVYRREDVPTGLHFDANPREGDPVVVPTGPFPLRCRQPMPRQIEASGRPWLQSATMPEMKAIFFAEGPDMRPGVQLKPFENVNIYPFIAEILGLECRRRSMGR